MKTKRKTFEGHSLVNSPPKAKIHSTLLTGGTFYSGSTSRRVPELGFILDDGDGAALVVVSECACKVYLDCPLAALLERAGDHFDSTTVERRSAVKSKPKAKVKAKR